MGQYLDILKRQIGDQSDIRDKRPFRPVRNNSFGRFSRIGRHAKQFCQPVLEALERRCPDHIDHRRWRQAIADGSHFLGQWGEQAAALGWTARDLFGLAEIPDKPGPRYQRLSRYDQTGLIWMLQGRSVVALTKDTAVIQTTNGTLSYYKLLKPAGRAQQ